MLQYLFVVKLDFYALTNLQAEAKELSVDVTANKQAELKESEETNDSPLTTESTTSTTSTSSSTVNTIEFAATAGEARKRVGKKKDVRSASMSMKDKIDIFQKM